MKVWVLSWKYYDDSGYAVARVYADQSSAERDRDFMAAYTESREWRLDELNVIGAI